MGITGSPVIVTRPYLRLEYVYKIATARVVIGQQMFVFIYVGSARAQYWPHIGRDDWAGAARARQLA